MDYGLWTRYMIGDIEEPLQGSILGVVIDSVRALVIGVVRPTLSECCHLSHTLTPIARVVVAELERHVLGCAARGDDALVPLVGGVIIVIAGGCSVFVSVGHCGAVVPSSQLPFTSKLVWVVVQWSAVLVNCYKFALGFWSVHCWRLAAGDCLQDT